MGKPKMWHRAVQRWKRHAGVLSVVFAVVALTLLVVVVVQALMLRSRGWTVQWQWGNVAEWVAGVGTLAAFGALFYAAREWGIAHAERRDRIQADRRRQAELISAWVHREETSDLDRHATIGLANASDGVVNDVQIQATCGPVNQKPNDRYLMMELRAFGYLRELPPGRWGVRLKLGDVRMTAESLAIHFSDQGGVEWTRDPRGALLETSDKPFPLPPLGPWSWQAGDLSEWQKDLVVRRSSLTYVPIQVLERLEL
jgi:hypothetical protein